MPDAFDRIRETLDRNLFVEAGAGTGKTAALVERIVALVRAGVPIGEIVAITFTEKAAAELRERVRARLEAAGEGAGPIVAALAALDAAPISTIHAFAGDVLRSFAAEAGVDPDYRVIDEVAAGRRFRQRWREQLEHLGNDARAREVFARLLRLGLTPAHVERLAFELWDRAAIARIAAHVRPGSSVEWPDVSRLREALSAIPLERAPADDPFAMRLKNLDGLVALLEGADDDRREPLLASAGLSGLKFRVSNQATWGPDLRHYQELAEEVRDALVTVLERAREEALLAVLPYVAEFVLAEREARCREGALTFDDLISLASELVGSDLDARRRLRERYRTLLIDEFQDTDPLQFELARAFATGPGGGGLEAGRLVLVGDPKQSIYRFRGADMAIYDAARALFRGSEDVVLATSRRATPPIVAFVNRTFSHLFAETQAGVSPPYHDLEPAREDQPRGHPVAVIGGVVQTAAAEVRRMEAAAVAAACRAIVTGAWEVADRRGGGHRPAAYRDIAILIPARTGLPDLERALDGAGLPYRVESGSLVFQTQEIRDLTNILAAIDEPADGVAVVAALRSPAFACSDRELAEHRLAGGSFNYLAPRHPPGPVAEAMARLRTFHETRKERSIADLTHLVLAETGFVASGTLHRGDRDSFRRARFVLEQARAFEATGPQPLRAFVDWLEDRGARPIVDHEGAGLDDDEDAVRVLTVHGAKGLEFPIVVVAGFGANLRTPPAPVYALDPRGNLAMSIGTKSGGSQFRAGDVDSVEHREREHAKAELKRLLYVAATRARDHLVISLFRGTAAKQSGVAHLEEAMVVDELPRLDTDNSAAPAPRSRLTNIVVEMPREEAAPREEVVARARRLRVTSATALADLKKGREDDSEPWSRGRGGTRLGRAVHAVIQSAPLDGRPDVVATLARAQSVAEAIPEREGEIVELASRAFGTAAMARARGATRTLREVPFAVDLDGTLVEGFVDLVIEGGDGLEIVDWKTDTIGPDEVERRMEAYRLQAGLYVLGLERATGKRVARVTYVFLAAGIEHTPGDPRELAAAASEQLHSLFRAG